MDPPYRQPPPAIPAVNQRPERVAMGMRGEYHELRPSEMNTPSPPLAHGQPREESQPSGPASTDHNDAELGEPDTGASTGPHPGRTAEQRSNWTTYPYPDPLSEPP